MLSPMAFDFCVYSAMATTWRKNRLSLVGTPLTEDIRLKIFVSRDQTIFSIDLLSDGDSVYTREILYENFSTPVKTSLICTMTPVKTCSKFLHFFFFPISSVCRHPGDSHKLVAIFGGHKNCIHYVYVVRWRLLNVPIGIEYVCIMIWGGGFG